MDIVLGGQVVILLFFGVCLKNLSSFYSLKISVSIPGSIIMIRVRVCSLHYLISVDLPTGHLPGSSSFFFQFDDRFYETSNDRNPVLKISRRSHATGSKFNRLTLSHRG